LAWAKRGCGMGTCDCDCDSWHGYHFIESRASSLGLFPSTRTYLDSIPLADLSSNLEGLLGVPWNIDDYEPPHPYLVVTYSGLPQLPTLLGDSFCMGPA